MNKALKIFQFVFICIFTFIFIFSCGKDDGNSGGTNEPNFGDAPVNPDQTLLVDMVNDVRTSGCKCGNTNMPAVEPITWNDVLEASARKHSAYMNSEDELTHLSADSSNAGDRIETEGYPLIVGSWAENLAKGFADEQSVFDAWIDSEGHCENIMKAEAREMGIGTSGAFWTMVLARQ